MITLYGIKNCDTMKKARKWLDDHRIEYHLHDYRTDGVPAETLQNWVKILGWETLLNRRGTTWRRLPEPQRENLNETRAIQLMLKQPAIIKRPVLELGKSLLVGFSEKDYEKLLR
jgi:arsenate reductase